MHGCGMHTFGNYIHIAHYSTYFSKRHNRTEGTKHGVILIKFFGHHLEEITGFCRGMIDIFAISGCKAAHLFTDVAGQPIVPIFEGR
jgi:hypothetical protein